MILQFIKEYGEYTVGEVVQIDDMTTGHHLLNLKVCKILSDSMQRAVTKLIARVGEQYISAGRISTETVEEILEVEKQLEAEKTLIRLKATEDELAEDELEKESDDKSMDDMSRDELLAHAEENDVELTDPQKRLRVPKLRAFIAKRL